MVSCATEIGFRTRRGKVFMGFEEGDPHFWKCSNRTSSTHCSSSHEQQSQRETVATPSLTLCGIAVGVND